MSVTLKDVAQAARVSVSTASRALSGTGLTSERTQQRLTRIARELGYRPRVALEDALPDLITSYRAARS